MKHCLRHPRQSTIHFLFALHCRTKKFCLYNGYKKKALNIELCITLRPWDALNVASVVQYAHYHKTLLLKFYSHTPHCQIALFDAVCFVISNYLQHLHNFMLQLSQSNCISTAAVFCILFSYWKKEKYLECRNLLAEHNAKLLFLSWLQ